MLSRRSHDIPLVLLAFALLLPSAASADKRIEDEESLTSSATSLIERLNNQLAARGVNVRIAKAAFLAAPNAPEVGQTIFANDRTKQLDTQWVPGDPRRGGRKTITYAVDLADCNVFPGSAAIEGAIDRAMTTWANVSCAPIPIVKVPCSSADADVTDGLLGFGGIGTPGTADIIHGGWLPAAFFDAAIPGGGSSVLASTFTYFFVDGPTDSDVNGDKKLDTAFAEIFYNSAFPWAIDGAMPPVDVESVALHEAGHALSQDHFGKIFETDANGKRHFSPYAVMNALLTQPEHTLQGSDTSAHCGLWANWPR